LVLVAQELLPVLEFSLLRYAAAKTPPGKIKTLAKVRQITEGYSQRFAG
jgi:hypothetical protein